MLIKLTSQYLAHNRASINVSCFHNEHYLSIITTWSSSVVCHHHHPPLLFTFRLFLKSQATTNRKNTKTGWLTMRWWKRLFYWNISGIICSRSGDHMTKSSQQQSLWKGHCVRASPQTYKIITSAVIHLKLWPRFKYWIQRIPDK